MTAKSDDALLGSNDFTIEFWMKAKTSSINNVSILSQSSQSHNQFNYPRLSIDIMLWGNNPDKPSYEGLLEIRPKVVGGKKAAFFKNQGK